MKKKIEKIRWQAAQKFEFNDWANMPNIVTNEWKELVKKYSKLFPKISKQVGLKASDLVLDVGCGPTVPARLLGVGKVTGIEPLADKLKISGRKYLPSVNIVCGKAEKMPFKDHTFQFVVCRNVIDHTQDPKVIIREVKRVLKKNGHFLLISYTYSPFITFVKNASERLGLFRNVGHPFTFTPEMLDQLVVPEFEISQRYTIHTGKDSTDYGKMGEEIVDDSPLHKILIFINNRVLRSTWFLKEYGFLCTPNSHL